MSKQQTAVDYLVEQFAKYYSIHQLDEEIEQAKEMEKEQMKEAVLSQVTKHKTFRSLFEKQFEQYYKETYESKGSDDHIGDANEMIESVQKLIDKDIFNQAILAMEEMYGSGCDAEIDAYFRGAKWMRQELNKQV